MLSTGGAKAPRMRKSEPIRSRESWAEALGELGPCARGMLACVTVLLCLAGIVAVGKHRVDRRAERWRARNSTFDHGCGQRERLAQCPGYAECMRMVVGFDEPSFLAAVRAARAGPPPRPTARRWCTKAGCIDTASCEQPFKLYQYTRADLASLELSHCLAETNLSHAAAQGLLTTDPKRACAFWFELDNNCRFLHQLRRLPHWRGNGLNHLIVQHGDAGIDAAARERHFGRAALAQGHATASRFVHGLDIALGLHPRLLPADARSARDEPGAGASAAPRRAADLPPWGRRYLLTFKGTESHPSRARASFHHDERRRVILSFFPNGHHCMPSTSLARPFALERGRVLPPLHADCCARMRKLYQAYDYKELFNSTFGLVMPGAQPATYRLAEVLAFGVIPVFYGYDDAMLPWDEVIDWPALSLAAPIDVDFEKALLPRLEGLLDDRARLLAMQREGRRVFARYFASLDASAGDRATIETLQRRFSFERARQR